MHWTWAERLCDALLVNAAHRLARVAEYGRDARGWLTKLSPASDADKLLEEYSPARPMDATEQQTRLEKMRSQLDFLERLGEKESVDEQTIAALFEGEERIGEYAANIERSLAALAAVSAGRETIDRALSAALPIPYPEYRDAALITLGVSILASPDASWVRPRLQRILRTTLDEEGVTFTFELPSILLAEAQRRGRPAVALTEYVNMGLASDDRWSTSMRARSALAAALHWQGRKLGLCCENSA